ncbi:MAG: putative membrane protein [Microgenomates group bacterium LiPW_31]|nr:MAG: putative membrane protein [Microgenomates group bacterium LiPW_31]
MAIKKYLRLFLINLVSFWLVAKLVGGVNYSGGFQTLAWAALALMIVNLTVRPLINLLLLPINLITLGAFRWLVNVLALYLVTLVVPQLKISAFLFPGFNYQGFIIPPVYLAIFWVLVIASFLISLITSFFLWLAE